MNHRKSLLSAAIFSCLVFGAQAQAWLDMPHASLEGKTPAAFAAEGGSERVRSILNAIQHGGVA